MGRKVNDWAWKQKLPTGEKIVLLSLAQYADDKTGECFPGVDRIAEECGYGEKSVRRHRAALVGRGLIELSRRSHGSRRTSDRTTIVGYLLAVNLTARPSGQSDPAKRSICPPQEVNLTARSNRGTSKRNQSGGTPRAGAREPAPSSVADPDLSVAVLEAFNEIIGGEYQATGKTGQPTSYVRAIDARLCDRPELGLEQLRAILERNARAPWWKESKPTPRTLFGSEAQFEATLTNDGVRRSGRTVRRNVDRPNGGRREKVPW